MINLLDVLDRHAKLSTRKRVDGMTAEHYAFVRCYAAKYQAFLDKGGRPISRESLTEFLVTSDLAESTRSTIAADLGKMLYWHKLLDKDDFDVVRRAFRMPQDPWSTKGLTPEIVEQLIAYSHQTYHDFACRRNPAIVMLLATLGPRIKQLCSLDMEDVTHDGQWVVFNFVRLKETRKGLLKTYDAKQMPVDMSIGRFNFGRIFERYLDARRLLAGDSGPLFISEQKRRISTRYIQHFISTMGRKLDLPKLTPHSFRHFVGTTIANKYGIHQAAIVLGHHDINTTMRYINPATVNVGNMIGGLYEKTQEGRRSTPDTGTSNEDS